MENRDTTRRGSRAVGALLWGALGLTIVGCVIMVATMKQAARRRTVPAVPKEASVPVRTMDVAPRSMPDTLRLPGRIEPANDVLLSAEKPGPIVMLGADEGDSVTAGQVLLRVDDRTWKAILERAQVEKRDAERDRERWAELKKAGAVSESDFDAIDRRLRLATAAVEEAQAQMDHCEIRSPIAGVVEERSVEVGEHVGEGTPCFRIVDATRVKILIDIPEKDVRYIAPGRKVELRVPALEGRIFTGEVAFVSSAAAAQSNSFRTELTAGNPDGLLRGGMLVEAEIVRRVRADIIVVPLAAVVPRRGEHVVFTVREGRALRHTVKIDSIAGQEAALSAGLEAGEKLVIDGQRLLSDGAGVEVRNE